MRIEIGPRDVEQESVVLARRDIPGRAGKSSAPLAGLSGAVGEMLDTIQADMLAAATVFRDANIQPAQDYEEFKQIVPSGWARAHWCGDLACEAKVKEDTKATIRLIPFEGGEGKGSCVVCGKEAKHTVYYAKAY